MDGEHKLLILDDLMDDVINDKTCQRLFSRHSHHSNLTIVFLNQNMYSRGRCSRTIALNTHYLILLRNSRDLRQISTLARQTGMGKQLTEAYFDAVSRPFGYLLLDLHPQNEHDHFRLRTSIFPPDPVLVYLKESEF